MGSGLETQGLALCDGKGPAPPHGLHSMVPEGGGGVLSLEKGTDCAPTGTELWLSRANIAKKEGLPSRSTCQYGAVQFVCIRILHQITNVCMQSCSKKQTIQ